MKIRRADEHRLVIEDFPLWLAFLCIPLSLGGLVAFLACVVTPGHGVKERIFDLVWAVAWFSAAAIFVKRSVFDLDLAGRTLRWRRRGMFENARGTFPFADVRSVNVECIRSGGRDPSRRADYRLVIHLRDGQTVPLTLTYRGQRSPEGYDQIRRRMSEAMGVPPATADDDVGELLKAGRKFDAVLMVQEAHRISADEAYRRVEAMKAEETKLKNGTAR